MRHGRTLVILFLLSTPLVTTRLYASDEIQWFSFLRSVWFDRDLNFDNEYRYLEAHGAAAGSLFHETFLQDTTDTGYRLTFGTIGSSILWAPFYAVGDVTARLLHAMGRDVAVDGYSKPYIAAVCYGSAFYGLVGILISGHIAGRLVGQSRAAQIAVWFGTPLFFYMYISPVMAHACEAFAVSLFLLAWLNARAAWSTRGLVALGAATSLMIMVREQDLFFVAGPAADWLVTVVARLRQPSTVRPPVAPLLVSAAAGALVAAVVYLPQAVAYLTINGHLGPPKQVNNKMSWHSPHAWSVLFSTEHGLLFWTPLVAIALAGLVMLALGRTPTSANDPDRRRIGWCLILMVALQIYITGVVDSWTLEGAFGQRRFISLTPLLVVGLVAVFERARRSSVAVRRGLAAAVIVCIWWNLGLTAAFGAQLMDRKRLTLADNARTVFVDLPLQGPGLAWRYLTNRASFYKPPASAPR